MLTPQPVVWSDVFIFFVYNFQTFCLSCTPFISCLIYTGSLLKISRVRVKACVGYAEFESGRKKLRPGKLKTHKTMYDNTSRAYAVNKIHVHKVNDIKRFYEAVKTFCFCVLARWPFIRNYIIIPVTISQ